MACSYPVNARENAISLHELDEKIAAAEEAVGKAEEALLAFMERGTVDTIGIAINSANIDDSNNIDSKEDLRTAGRGGSTNAGIIDEGKRNLEGEQGSTASVAGDNRAHLSQITHKRPIRMADVEALELVLNNAVSYRDELKSTRKYLVERQRSRAVRDQALGLVATIFLVRFASPASSFNCLGGGNNDAYNGDKGEEKEEEYFSGSGVGDFVLELTALNEASGITGLLYVMRGWFAVYLEGDNSEVSKLVKEVFNNNNNSSARGYSSTTNYFINRRNNMKRFQTFVNVYKERLPFGSLRRFPNDPLKVIHVESPAISLVPREEQSSTGGGPVEHGKISTANSDSGGSGPPSKVAVVQAPAESEVLREMSSLINLYEYIPPLNTANKGPRFKSFSESLDTSKEDEPEVEKNREVLTIKGEQKQESSSYSSSTSASSRTSYGLIDRKKRPSLSEIAKKRMKTSDVTSTYLSPSPSSNSTPSSCSSSKANEAISIKADEAKRERMSQAVPRPIFPVVARYVVMVSPFNGNIWQLGEEMARERRARQQSLSNSLERQKLCAEIEDELTEYHQTLSALLSSVYQTVLRELSMPIDTNRMRVGMVGPHTTDGLIFLIESEDVSYVVERIYSMIARSPPGCFYANLAIREVYQPVVTVHHCDQSTGLIMNGRCTVVGPAIRVVRKMQQLASQEGWPLLFSHTVADKMREHDKLYDDIDKTLVDKVSGRYYSVEDLVNNKDNPGRASTTRADRLRRKVSALTSVGTYLIDREPIEMFIHDKTVDEIVNKGHQEIGEKSHPSPTGYPSPASLPIDHSVVKIGKASKEETGHLELIRGVTEGELPHYYTLVDYKNDASLLKIYRTLAKDRAGEVTREVFEDYYRYKLNHVISPTSEEFNKILGKTADPSVVTFDQFCMAMYHYQRS